jgi:hypothetical protein
VKPYREQAGYWIQLAGYALAWLAGAFMTIIGLLVAVARRSQSGEWASAFLVLFLLLCMAALTALLVAVWKARALPADVRWMAFARGERPAEAVSASVWWWMRGVWYGWISVIVALAAAMALAAVLRFTE